jgi:hypothetical protein
MKAKGACFGFAAAVILILPTLTFAQSGIAGVVKDTTGAVLPGVTVEASSPALIEKVRTVVTDGEGLYKLVDLRPGTYTVTFTLAGFSTLKRDAIDLPSNFTATVNAELRVGTLEETLTVAGAAPVVDVQTTTQTTVMSKSVLDSLPVGRSPHNFALLTPGVTGVNLGGFSTGRDANGLSLHGSPTSEATVSIDGDRINMAGQAGGAFVTTRLNPAMIEELAMVTSGTSAEYAGAGIQTNVIPKEGGNTYSGYFYSMWSYEGWQASNVTDELRAQAIGATGIVKQWDVNPAVGGRIRRDKLWFFASVRTSAIIQNRPGLYENLTPGAWVYTNDLNKPSTSKITDPDYSGRLTWQVTAKDKVNFFASAQPRAHWQHGYENVGWTTEATAHYTYYPNLVMQAVWKRPATNRLLFEAGWNIYSTVLKAAPQPGTTATDPSVISVTEQSNGLVYRSGPLGNSSSYGNPVHDSAVWNYRGSTAYITGSHYFKFGGNLRQTNYAMSRYTNMDINYRFRNGVPNQVTLSAAPYIYHSHIKADAGLYAQDQWTIRRLTMNFGVRYDYFNGWNEPEDLPAGRFVPARRFPGSKGTPTWHDISPRLGASFDVFGDSRTALKVTFGRYATVAGNSVVNDANATSRSVLTATRVWTDSNRDFVPDCDLRNPLANGECALISNSNFGLTDPRQATTDYDVLHGFGVRPYSWESSVALQRELIRGLSVNAGYYRRLFGNFTVTHNALFEPEDYTEYCITAPVDSRLPLDVSGSRICGLYDISPAKFPQSQSVVSRVEKFGKQTQIYNGVDLTTTARLPNGVQFTGGLNTGATSTNRCFVVDSPQELRFCDVNPPWKPNFKFFSVMPIFWNVQTTLVYQTIPGSQLQANYTASSAEIAPSLGRNLAAGAGANVTVPLIPPGTTFLERQHQVDLRFTRTFPVRRGRIIAGIDVNNLLNAHAVWNVNTTYGPSWRRANQIMVGRNMQLNVQLSF